MHINQAFMLVVGQRVACPPDRGAAAYIGVVEQISDNVCENMHGTKYIWLTVRGPNGFASGWPSNRLGTV